MVCREMRDWLGAGDSQSWDDGYAVYAVLSVCCIRCMVYSVYAVLGVNSWSCHGEIDKNDSTSCSWVMVELRIRTIVLRQDAAKLVLATGPGSGQRSGFGPQKQVGSVPNPAKNPTC